MIADIWTIVWKDWKESFAAQGSRRGGLMRLLILVFVFGVFLPLQSGRAWVESPVVLIYWMWVPGFLVTGLVADAIAGERERHTLETLLASRMPDRAILFGKVLAAVGYGLGLTVVSLFLGLVTVNVAYGRSELLLYPPLTVAGGIGLGLLTAGLAASAGVLVSLRAATVRQAAQTLSIATMLVLFVPILALQALQKALPGVSAIEFTAFLETMNWAWVLLGAMGALALIDGILLVAGMARFKRARLILD